MNWSHLEGEARMIISRNLTPNVVGADIDFVAENGHLHLTYYLTDAATEADEEEREIALCELIAAFPEIRTATSAFGQAAEVHHRMIFHRSG